MHKVAHLLGSFISESKVEHPYSNTYNRSFTQNTLFEKFYIKITFSGQHLKALSIKKCEKFYVLGYLTKTSISALNHLKKLATYDLLFLIVICSLKVSITTPLK